MFNDYIESQRENIINDLITLINIPSVNGKPELNLPYGKSVDEALEKAVSIAKDMGFKARNLKTVAEIVYGGDETADNDKVYIACHLDVVPAGDGWTVTEPFNGKVENGRIYGRGALDNKGPSIAVLYALKALKEMGFKPKAEVRLVLGGAEGVIFSKFHMNTVNETGELVLKSISGGAAFNCVPDKCKAEVLINYPELKQDIEATLITYSESHDKFQYSINDNLLSLKTFGISAHGSVPETGENAIIEMVKLLRIIFHGIECNNSFINFILQYFSDDTKGINLGISCEDDISGALSVNMGMCEYLDNKGWVSLDIRVPVSVDTDDINRKLQKIADHLSDYRIIYENIKTNRGTHMPKESPFLQRLAACYEKITNSKADFLSARGVTYAKCFEGRGVAFGPISEEGHNSPEKGEGGGIHGKDEFFDIDALLRVSKIYALAIYDLWCI
ncbi:MAG: Xaa-His dipeptidase [Clostridia bacterium]|nr:Xaa-His dipeptidase [Clostridia bacterium]